jgi:hypothetical protein
MQALRNLIPKNKIPNSKFQIPKKTRQALGNQTLLVSRQERKYWTGFSIFAFGAKYVSWIQLFLSHSYNDIQPHARKIL